MKIVIDISEEDFINIFKEGTETNTLFDVIRKGTPLPKGHGKLIDADELLEKQYCIDDSATLSTRDVVDVEDVDDAPTIIEADTESEDN